MVIKSPRRIQDELVQAEAGNREQKLVLVGAGVMVDKQLVLEIMGAII